jgi:hypothetical protein
MLVRRGWKFTCKRKMLRHLQRVSVRDKRIDVIIMSMKIAVSDRQLQIQVRILNYCHSLTKMNIFTSDALSANCCRCTLP